MALPADGGAVARAHDRVAPPIPHDGGRRRLQDGAHERDRLPSATSSGSVQSPPSLRTAGGTVSNGPHPLTYRRIAVTWNVPVPASALAVSAVSLPLFPFSAVAVGPHQSPTEKRTRRNLRRP